MIDTPVKVFTPSKYQQGVFDWIENETGDAVVNAVAGSGKTTTLLQAATQLKVKRALFVAFNKLIADELSNKLRDSGSIMRASTIHSFGKDCLEKHLNTKARVQSNKYLKLCRAYLKAQGIKHEGVVRNLYKLVNFSQLTLLEPTEKNLLHIVDHYDLKDIKVTDNTWLILVPAVQVILDQGIQAYLQEHVIDFNDMVWLPTVLNVAVPQYNFIFVDECQDLNKAQLELILKGRAPGGRFLFVGDRRQSLYGFAGADTESVDNIVKRTHAVELPLSICYRCATSHIEVARQVVSEIEPSPYAPAGEVGIIKYAELAQVEPSAENTVAILCRMTAPLVSACLKMISEGRRAIVRGKDIGKSITDIIDKLQELKTSSQLRVIDIPEGLDYYRQVQLAALQVREDNELAIEALYDRCDTVTALLQAYLAECEQANSTPFLDGFKNFITSKFDDSLDDNMFVFSTVHKAKGLEFDSVYLLEAARTMPHPAAKKDWQIDQEYNIIYVALTRAKQRLYFLDKPISWLKLPTTDEEMEAEEIHSKLLERAQPLPAGSIVDGEETTATKIDTGSRRGRGRPRKGGVTAAIRDRVNISLDVDVIRFLRTKENYSEWLESFVLASPEFDEFIKQE
jgi:superfamily I DNA/RNA helicase